MKKTKFVVAFLLVCVLSIGGAVSVFGAVSYGGEYMDVVASDSKMYNIPYFENKNVLFLKKGTYEYLLVSPVVNNIYNESQLYILCTLWQRVTSADDSSWKNSNESEFFVIPISAIDSYVYYANESLTYDGTVFFQQTEAPVARVAVVLPEMVQAEVIPILTIVIGGLALLIGSMVLLPKLKLFLRA